MVDIKKSYLLRGTMLPQLTVWSRRLQCGQKELTAGLILARYYMRDEQKSERSCDRTTRTERQRRGSLSEMRRGSWPRTQLGFVSSCNNGGKLIWKRKCRLCYKKNMTNLNHVRIYFTDIIMVVQDL